MNNRILPDGTVEYDKKFDGYESDLKPYGSSIPTQLVERVPQVARWRRRESEEEKDKLEN